MPNPKMNFLDAGSASELLAQRKAAEDAFAAATQVPEAMMRRMGGELDQSDMDEYILLSKAYLGGPNIPFEIQLLAFDKEGEEPTGIILDKNLIGDMSVVDFLRTIIPLRDRKQEFGVCKGVHDPEALLEVKQRAVLIYTRCALELAEAEAIADAATEELAATGGMDMSVTRRAELTKLAKCGPSSRMVYFPAPAGATLGKNGYIHLFPGYPDSPAGKYRGSDGAAFDALECVTFIGKHFPDVEDQILAALADA